MHRGTVALVMLLIAITPIVLLAFCLYLGHQPAGCGLGGSLLLVIVTASMLAQASLLPGSRFVPGVVLVRPIDPLDRPVPPPEA